MKNKETQNYEKNIKMFFKVKQEKGTLVMVSEKDKPDLYYKVEDSKVHENGNFQTELKLIGLTRNG